tara:strand:- start:115 stop:342 length:228 start_codon:yes stop_codon:yes gene_type:complete
MTNFIKAAATLDNIDEVKKDIRELIISIDKSNQHAQEIIFQGIKDMNQLKMQITGLNNETDKIIELIKKEILEQS